MAVPGQTLKGLETSNMVSGIPNPECKKYEYPAKRLCGEPLRIHG